MHEHDTSYQRPLRIVAMGGSVNGNTDVCCRAWHDLGNSFLLVGYGSAEHPDNTRFGRLSSLERGDVVITDEQTDPRDLVALVEAFSPTRSCAGVGTDRRASGTC